MTVRLQLLTESRGSTARRCMREEHYRYELGIVPIGATTEPLRFGTLGHYGLEHRWLNLGMIADELAAALQAVDDEATEETDEFERVRVEELLRGYVVRWENDVVEYDVIGAELEFRGPLVNPETGAASRTFQRAGKLDVLVQERAGERRKLIVEHKFSGEDIHAASPFWARLRMGGQSSGYIRGAELLGHQVDAVLYDVIAKPGLRPYKATPVEQREYTKAKYKRCPFCGKKGADAPPHRFELADHGLVVQCEEDPENPDRRRVMTDPGGRLYANQREHDETLDEYRERVRNDIADHPNDYYQRAEVVRLERQLLEHDLETWQLGQQLREAHRLGIAPRNWDACQRYGSLCGYFPVCSGDTEIGSHLFRPLDWVHPELTKEITP